MRRANAPSASASALGSCRRRQRAQPAGGLEQRRRLQLAAPQVALDRDVRRVGVLALQQLTFGERRAGLRERAQLLGVIVARELGERPREQQVAGRDREPAPGDGGHRRAAAPQLGAVDQVVVDERRRVHELDRHGRAHQALLAVRVCGGPARRLGREHDQQRPQPLAAGHDRGVGVGCERRAGLRGHALEVALGARPCARAAPRRARRMIASSPSTPPGGTLGDCAANHRAHHALSRRNGAGVDRDDAAGGEQ